MKRENDIKQVCLDVLSKDGIEDDFSVEMAESIAAELMVKGYVRFDQVVLDPQKCVQLMATILNGFRAEQPFALLEEDQSDEATQDDSPANGEVNAEAVS